MLFVWALTNFFDSLQGGSLVDKNGHFIGTKMPIFNNLGNSSQHLKFNAGQNSSDGC